MSQDKSQCHVCSERSGVIAPHACDEPDCPGPVNKRKLEAFDQLLAACEAILSGVSLDVYRVAAADMGRMAPAEAAFALLRAAIARAKGQQP